MILNLISLALGSLGAIAILLRSRDRREAARAARLRRICGLAL